MKAQWEVVHVNPVGGWLRPYWVVEDKAAKGFREFLMFPDNRTIRHFKSAETAEAALAAQIKKEARS